MIDKNQKPPEQNKPYEPPRVFRVSLRPEEAVLGHCKMSGQGPVNSSCMALVCKALGS